MPIILAPGGNAAPNVLAIVQAELDDWTEPTFPTVPNPTGIGIGEALLVQASGTIGPAVFLGDDTDTFSVSAGMNVLLSIHVDAGILGSALAPSVTVLDSSGVALFAYIYATDGSDLQYEATIPATGTYTVVVGGVASSMGEYRIFFATSIGAKIYDNEGASYVDTSNYDHVFYANPGLISATGGPQTDLFIWQPGDSIDAAFTGGGGFLDSAEIWGSNVANSVSVTVGLSNGVHLGSSLNIGLYTTEFLDFRARGGNDTFTIADLSTTHMTNGTIRYFAGSGNDKLLATAVTSNPITAYGGPGKDELRSGARADYLDGGAANDILAPGPNDDVVIGGAGADIFDFNKVLDSQPSDPDRILDFRHAQGDRVDLRTIDADQRPGHGGNQAFTFIGNETFAHYKMVHGSAAGTVRYAGGLLQANVDNDLAPEFSLRFIGVAVLVSGDIFL